MKSNYVQRSEVATSPNFVVNVQPLFVNSFVPCNCRKFTFVLSSHLCLCISGKLTNNLIRDLEVADHMNGKKNFDRSKANI